MVIARTAHALLLAFSIGCQPTVVGPKVDAVLPDWGFNGEPTQVEVFGDHFFAGIDATGSDLEAFDRDFVLDLESSSGGVHRIGAVRQDSNEALAGTVPSGLEPGWYDLSVTTPGGQNARLEDAFEVTDTRADSLRLTADRTNLRVNDMAIIEITLRSPDGAVVDESVPIRVTAATGEGEPAPVSFDLSGLTGGEEAVPGFEAEGRLSPGGGGYIGVSSSTPAHVWVNVEAIIRDDSTLGASQLVSFTAGNTHSLLIERVGSEGPVVAGEPVDVSLRLVDEGGHTVSGVTASVALQETCIGGLYQSTHTFVDDTVIEARPTMACPMNSIRAFGVVETSSLSGQSGRFEVIPGGTSVLVADARPDSISAGTESTLITVVGADEFGNPTGEPTGGVAVHLDGEPIGLSSGLGSAECASSDSVETACDVRLNQARERYDLDVVSLEGLVGPVNPVEVRPGPGFAIFFSLGGGSAVAGVPYPVTLSVQDAFGNPILAPAESLEEMVFEDDFGGVDCVYLGAGTGDRDYSYQCTLYTAGSSNQLHAMAPDSGAIGSSELFEVKPGGLEQVDVTLDSSDGLVRVGESVAVAFEGLDAYGNRVAGEHPVHLENVAGGVTHGDLRLVDGVAAAFIGFTNALEGDSLWALSDGIRMGGTAAFDVEPGAASGLHAAADRLWGFTDSPFALTLNVVDEFGNPVPHADDLVHVSSVGALGPDVSLPWSTGESASYRFDSAGLGDMLVLSLGEWSAEIGPFDVGLDCGLPFGELMESTDTSGRMCVDGVSDTVVAPPEGGLIHFTVAKNMERPVRTDGSDAEVSIGVGDNGFLWGFGIDEAACGRQWGSRFWAGSPGVPVGPVSILPGSSVILPGAPGVLSTAELTVEAETCAGESAPASSLFARSTAGLLSSESGTVLAETGAGLELWLSDEGDAVIQLVAEDYLGGDDVTVLIGSDEAFGQVTVPVTGDYTAPLVRGVSPIGRMVSPVSSIDISFTEAMLEDTVSLLAERWVALTSDALPVEIDSAAFNERGDGLTIWLNEPTVLVEATLSISDDFRDAAGNQLDGDNDGTSGGAWERSIGDVVDEAPAIVRCGVSAPRFRPDGDDGLGDEADTLRIEVEASAPADRWRWDVVSEAGQWVNANTVDIGLTTSGSMVWDGRDAGGSVVPNGVYFIEISALDEHENTGGHCTVAAAVDNRVSP